MTTRGGGGAAAGDPPPWPPYSYVPGGPWPHPKSDPRGHGFGRDEPGGLRHGAALFNAGYYWEAHEAWEVPWHAAGRRGPVADLLRGLIKLAAAGVKLREGRPLGAATHLRRASACFASARSLAGSPRLLGLDLAALERLAATLAEDLPAEVGPREAPVVRVFAFTIEPGED